MIGFNDRKPLEVLHINQADKGGGAVVANWNLHRGLLEKGVGSRLLVGSCTAPDEHVSPCYPPGPISRASTRLLRLAGLNYPGILETFRLPRHPWVRACDIINFHNLHAGFFNYLAIPRLTAARPAVWTLHDMWGLTGHCACSLGCARWKIGCGRCPHPDTYPAVFRDGTALEWGLKQWAYSRSRLTIVCPSRWLAQLARQSMLSCFPIHHIANGVDTGVYRPMGQGHSRRMLGLPADRRVLMCAAANLRNPFKATDLLVKALAGLPDEVRRHLVLLTIGHGAKEIECHARLPCVNLGFIEDDSRKALAFSAADLFLHPTKADNFPLVLQEAMACGTPMVSFDVGGVGELVRHAQTGYLAEAGSVEGLREGILFLLSHPGIRQTMGEECRKIAAGEYSLELQARRYLALYEEVIRSQHKLGVRGTRT